MPLAWLKDRGVIRLRGETVKPFLQGLITQDVADLKPGEARYAALLTPQGKIIADFFVLDSGNGLLLDVSRSLAADLVKRLVFYRLRAKVQIEDVSDRYAVVAAWDADQIEGPLAYADPRLPALGQRAIVESVEEAGDADLYHAHRIALGVPEGGRDFAFGETFPHEADMDQLAGVDFRKGCFIGQEVVSRMQHRGTARTRLIPVRLDGPAPEPGAEILAGDRSIGAMGGAARGFGLAMVRLDRLGEAMAVGDPVSVGDTRLVPVKPGWASFPWPGAA
jgi:folate-binding protein YgfZ